MTQLEDIKIYAYLTPDPLDDDSFLEEDWISWLPGYKSGETEEGLPSYYHEDNVALYERIEEYTTGRFRSALERMWPILDGIYIKQIQIAIDYTNFKNSSALAGYDHHRSIPAKGIYVFHLDQSLLNRYLHDLNGNEQAHLDMNLWEHELVHLLDHWQSVKASAFYGSDIPQNNLEYYLLKYRSEGLANLFDLLDGKIRKFQSRTEAKEKFATNYRHIQSKVQALEKTTDEIRSEMYGGYDFYEVGPWVMLDMVGEILEAADLEPVEDLEKQIAQGIAIPDETKLKVLKMAFIVDNEWFLGNLDLEYI